MQYICGKFSNWTGQCVNAHKEFHQYDFSNAEVNILI